MKKILVQKLLNIFGWLVFLAIVFLISFRIYLEDQLIGIIFALIATMFMILRIDGQLKKDRDNKQDPR